MFEQICPIDPNEYMDLHLGMTKLIQYEQIKTCNFSKDVIDILLRLNWHCVISTQACIRLIWDGFIWQAEILERSILEATIKLIYISIDESSIEQKVDEYVNIISDINQYKRRKVVQDFLDGIDIDNDVTRHTFQTVAKDEVEMKYNKRERKKILEKWTFNSMTKEIDSYKIKGFDKLKYFQKYYADTSNYIHVDIDCLDLIWEREHRDKEEKEALTLAHMGRELSDLYIFNAVRTYALLNLYNLQESILTDYLKTKKKIIDEIDSLSEKWQDFYKEHYLNKDGKYP